ncbi:hypothetical protein SRHO_G00297860 [Serrasalmus rhombeus]
MLLPEKRRKTVLAGLAAELQRLSGIIIEVVFYFNEVHGSSSSLHLQEKALAGKAAFAAWQKEENMPSPSFSLDAQLRFHDKWLKIDLQRAFSPEGLSEMWNEMVKDEEIVFDREESAYPEDSADCAGAQKKDECNDKEKKEEEEASLSSVHHSIIETWDWGRQPGKQSC